jgi:hypothetical protein
MRKHGARSVSFAVALTSALLVLDGSSGIADVSIRWTRAPKETNRVAVEVVGLPDSTLRELKRSNWSAGQWNQLFAVYARQGDMMTDLRMPPMLGSYRINSNVLRFEPAFPLQSGVRYQAVLRPNKMLQAGLTKPLISAYDIPRPPENPTTVVKQIYPSADVLPENVLKFYVHFSAPMRRGHIYDYIQLRNESGKPIELPFLEIDEELWDRSLTRLTLFIDPGRIKRGVRPLEEIGPSLETGKRYSLVIDREWKDASGTPLAKTFEKHFKIGPPEREPLDPQHWKIHAPKSDSHDALEIAFPKPVDHALAQRMIRVFGPTSRDPVSGEITLLDHERRWRFAPTVPWTSGDYSLQIENIIEDLCGNNIGKPFEVDVFEGVQPRITNSVAKLSFHVR